MNNVKTLITVIVSFLILQELTAQELYKLVEVDAYGSCTDYVIKDAMEKTILVPDIVEHGMTCPTLLELRKDRLCFMDDSKIMLYDIATDSLYVLLEVYPDLDGYNGPCWSPSGNKVAFVMINQNRKYDYTDGCRIIILSLDDHLSIVGKQKFDCFLNFECGGMCYSACETDFKFIDENTFSYRRHIMIEDRPGQWEKIGIE